MHLFGFAVGDEAGASMAACNCTVIPSDRYRDRKKPGPRASRHLSRDTRRKIVAATISNSAAEMIMSIDAAYATARNKRFIPIAGGVRMTRPTRVIPAKAGIQPCVHDEAAA